MLTTSNRRQSRRTRGGWSRMWLKQMNRTAQTSTFLANHSEDMKVQAILTIFPCFCGSFHWVKLRLLGTIGGLQIRLVPLRFTLPAMARRAWSRWSQSFPSVGAIRAPEVQWLWLAWGSGRTSRQGLGNGLPGSGGAAGRCRKHTIYIYIYVCVCVLYIYICVCVYIYIYIY